MTASLTALAAVVVSDVAEANRGLRVEQVADDVTPVSPVKMTKVQYPPPEDDFVGLEMTKPNFGSFEGY